MKTILYYHYEDAHLYALLGLWKDVYYIQELIELCGFKAFFVEQVERPYSVRWFFYYNDGGHNVAYSAHMETHTDGKPVFIQLRKTLLSYYRNTLAIDVFNINNNNSNNNNNGSW